ncbi:unnamed protein product, partial [Closterium sp. NIES-53]
TRGGQRRSLPLPDDPTPQQLCEWVLQRARPGGGGFGFLLTAQSRQQSQQETFSTQVLSELFPQRCVTGSVEAAAPGASESAAALGASESAAALGARESAAPLGARASPATGPSSAEALHTFTLDSGASHCFFRDCTSLTPLAAPVPVSLADPTGGPVVTRASTVLACLAVPSGSLVDTFIPGGQRVAICTCSRTGRHLATFTRRPGSSLYTLTTAAAQTLLWHHRLGHPSLPRLCGMHSRLLVSVLPRSLPPLPHSPAPPCLPCVEGRQRAAPHSSEFPSTTSPLRTLHMDVWGLAPVGGTDQERYFLLVVDDYTRYTTFFPLRRKADVSGVLIPWIRATRCQLRERFSREFLVLILHSDLLAEFCRDEGIVQLFMLPASPQQNGIAEHRIGLIMERPRPHSGGRGRLAMCRCFVSGARSPLFAMPKRASSPLALSAASSLAFPTDALPWQFYHPRSRRVFSSQDVTFDEFVCYYRLHPVLLPQVMVGRKKGFVGRLMQRCPWLIAVHCVAHREALAVKDAAKKFPDFNIIDSRIRKTAENIGCSSISRDAFMELQDVDLKTQLEVQGIFNVRWLSCGDAVARFSEVLPILFWVWHKEDQAAYKIGTSFKFQFMLADVLEMLNTLNMAFQKLVVEIDEVKLLVDKLKLKLAQRYVEKRADYGTAKSKHLHAFLEKHGNPDKHEITIHDLDKQENTCTVKDALHEHPIGEGMGTNLESCIKLGQQFAQELIAKLDYRLGDLKHFDGEKLFMPNHYPPRLADREAWLNAHLYKLLDMFKEKLPST